MDKFIKNIDRFDTLQDAQRYYFNYYRKHGYPNYNIEDYNKERELKKLIDFDDSSIYQDGMLKQTMHACGFLWCYFPHWIDTRTLSSKSVSENWNDDEKLWSLIKKNLQYCIKHEHGKWSTNRIRQNAKVYCASSSVSNFRPTAAKYLYNTYGNKGHVYDPCGGWGGRLFGFLASNCESYTCCEPSTKSFDGLKNLANDFKYAGKDVTIIHECAEDYIPQKDSMDMCFTSPPYFNTEMYSDEETQSYKRYSTYGAWLDGFLSKVIENCHYCLKDDGYLLLNVANVKTAPTLEKDTVMIAMSKGFVLCDTLYLILSSISGKGVKTEPIFVFKKIDKVQ